MVLLYTLTSSAWTGHTSVVFSERMFRVPMSSQQRLIEIKKAYWYRNEDRTKFRQSHFRNLIFSLIAKWILFLMHCIMQFGGQIYLHIDLDAIFEFISETRVANLSFCQLAKFLMGYLDCIHEPSKALWLTTCKLWRTWELLFHPLSNNENERANDTRVANGRTE